MGDYRITIDAVGGHGCQRDARDGETVQPHCGSIYCPDCRARQLVRDLKASSNTIISAKLEHWPAQEMRYDGTVVPRAGNAGPIDDLLTGVRHGSF